MSDIKMRLAEIKEPTVQKCPLTGKLFEIKPGHPVFLLNNNPIDPTHAKQVGFDIDESVTIPENVNSKEKLTVFLQSTLELQRGSDQYLKLYRKHSPILPLK